MMDFLVGNQSGIRSPLPGDDGFDVTPRSAFGTTPDSGLFGAFAATPATGGGVRHETFHDHTGGVSLGRQMDEEEEEKENLEAGEFKVEGGSGSSTPSSYTFHSSPSSPIAGAKGEDHLMERLQEGHIPQHLRMEAYATLEAVPLGHLPHGTAERLQAIGTSAQERRRTQSEARHGIGGGGGAGSFATHLSGEGGSGGTGPIGSRMGFFAERSRILENRV